jgi:hypothetical protein
MTERPMWQIEWIDGGKEPQCPPDPRYPSGIDIRLTADTGAAGPTCTGALPYPAKRIGYYIVKCTTCNQSVVVTTAGRPDDPRSLQLACRLTH